MNAFCLEDCNLIWQNNKKKIHKNIVELNQTSNETEKKNRPHSSDIVTAPFIYTRSKPRLNKLIQSQCY